MIKRLWNFVCDVKDCQRVEIAGALYKEADVIIFLKPYDGETKQAVTQMITSQSKNIAILTYSRAQRVELRFKLI